ncbi:MAG TPA: hypothetical protein VJN64_10595 [Terriglobales bacterium]|nr:hypothetical protein [Terriglobales bacterium]
MKKVFCGFIVLLAFAVVSAQTPSSGGDQAQSSADQTAKTTKSGKKGNTLTGCLSGPNDEGAYLLKRKGSSKEIEVGGSDELSKHVGHEVRLHGSWAKSGEEVGEKEGSEKNEASEGKKGEMERHFKVASIDHISDTCSAAGAAKGGHMRHHHKAAAEGAAPAEGGASPTPSPSPSPQP